MFVNIERDRQTSATGQDVSQKELPTVTLSQKNLVLGIDLIREGGGAVTDILLANDSFSFAADDDFDSGSTPLMLSPDVEFNVPGDRPDLDIVNGKISVRLDADTAELGTSLGTTREKVITGEIKAFNSSETNPKLISHFQILARNLVEGGGVPGAPVSNFYTKAEADALFYTKAAVDALVAGGLPFESANVDFKTPATHNIATVPAGKKWLPLWFFDRTDAITTPAAAASIKLKTDGPRDLTSVVVSDSNAVDDITRVQLTDTTLVLAGEILQAEITVGSTAATHDGKFSVRIIEYDA